MAWVDRFSLAALGDVAAADLIQRSTQTRAAVDARVRPGALAAAEEVFSDDATIRQIALDVLENLSANDQDFQEALGWQRGTLATSAGDLRLRQHQGMYRIVLPEDATAAGMPTAARGTLWVEWIRGASAASSVARQTFALETDSSQKWWRRSSSAGWTEWEREDPRGVVGAGSRNGTMVTGVRTLPSESDVDDFHTDQDDGVWRVHDQNVADTLSNLPENTPGRLTVGWIRGATRGATTCSQRYLTQGGAEYQRERFTAGWNPWRRIGGGTVVVDGDVTRVDVVIAAGQSNMSGRGTPYGVNYGDVPDGRVWEFGSKVQTLRPADVPLDMHDDNQNAGLSPATVFAREWVRESPPGTVCLLVPAAHGGTGFSGTGTWNWSDESGQWSLTAAMLAQAQAAVQAAQTQWPGAEISVRCMLWHQGESDGPMTEADYATALTTLIGRVRAVYPDLPVILGELSPDRAGGVSGPTTGKVHQRIGELIYRAVLAHTPANGSREGDLTHLARVGVEGLGKNMCQAFPAAVASLDGVLVAPPMTVHAWRDGDAVHVEWSLPLCRATGYEAEASVDNGSSWQATGVTVTGRRAVIARAGVTHVRVATIGASATSRFTHAVPV